jgi:CubicO group peptidase (beta-lactamase class C family)
MDSVFPANLARHGVPGATIAVVKDERVLLVKGYGYADLENGTPVDGERTLFRIASMSKPFTWTAVMQLAEQGKIDLDSDVNAYLADFKIPDTYPGRPVTMRHLLTHTAGFEDLARHQEVLSFSDLRPIGQYCRENVPARVRPPGEEVSYSNYGAVLAACIVETASGKPFDRYLSEEILAPLGMERTSIAQPLPPGLSPDLTKSYISSGLSMQEMPDAIIEAAPAGAIASTARDMAAFMIAHLNGGRYRNATILRPETARMMQATAFRPAPGAGVDLGFYDMTLNGRRAIVHGGDTEVFHGILLLFPEEKTGLFVCYNAPGGAAARSDLIMRFADHYFPAAADGTVATAGDTGTTHPGKYAGTYTMNRRPYTTIWLFFSKPVEVQVAPSLSGTTLTATSLLREKSGAEISRWRPAGNGRFVRQGDMLTPAERAEGDLVFIESPKDGQVTGLVLTGLPMITFDRVPWYGTRAFTDSILIACITLFLLVLLWPAAGLARRYCSVRAPTQPRNLAPARWTAGAAALMCILFLAGIAYLSGSRELVLEYLISPEPPAILAAVLAIPVAAAVPAACSALFTARAWRGGEGNRWDRIHLTVVLAAFPVFVWWLNGWNLLGWRL